MPVVLVKEVVLDENEVAVCKVVPVLELDPLRDNDPCDDGDDDTEVGVCDGIVLFMDEEEDKVIAEAADVV